MAGAELFGPLLEATLATSAAIVVVLALRRGLRQAFGPGPAYAGWLLVPAALVAVLLPAREAAVAVAATPAAVPAIGATAVAAGTLPLDFPAALVAGWAVGVLIAGIRTLVQQRAFERGLGPLRRRDDGCWQATTVAGLPAALGLLRPRIVVPADFDARYSDEQRRLMRLHERIHIRRGDLPLNAAVAALRCLFWFNPLVHVAARHFRHDQELACDARVVRRHPHRRRAYGEAMLHTQLAGQSSPLGCHWGFSHPLRERIEMLKQNRKSGRRVVAGVVLVASLAVATAAVAWAAQPERVAVPGGGPAAALDGAAAGHAADGYVVGLGVHIDDSGLMASSGQVTPGREHVYGYDYQGQHWDVALTVTPRDAGTHVIALRILRDGRLQATPSLVVREGEDAGITVGQRTDDRLVEGLELGLVVRRAGAGAQATTGATRIHAPPAYPAAAAAGGVGGKVVLLVSIDAAGKPTLVEVERSEPAGVFDAASIEAAYQWRFDPKIEDGRAVPSQLRVPVRFEPPAADDASVGATVPG